MSFRPAPSLPLAEPWHCLGHSTQEAVFCYSEFLAGLMFLDEPVSLYTVSLLPRGSAFLAERPPADSSRSQLSNGAWPCSSGLRRLWSTHGGGHRTRLACAPPRPSPGASNYTFTVCRSPGGLRRPEPEPGKRVQFASPCRPAQPSRAQQGEVQTRIPISSAPLQTFL